LVSFGFLCFPIGQSIGSSTCLNVFGQADSSTHLAVLKTMIQLHATFSGIRYSDNSLATSYDHL